MVNNNMGVGRRILAVIALLLVCAGIALQFIVILSGSSAGGPTKLVYMLQTTTDGIPTFRNPTRWTFLALCSSDGGPQNTDCGKTGAAAPFNPPQNFATAMYVPYQFIMTARFYNLSRAMFGMWIVGTFFAVFSVCLSIPALFNLTGSFKGGFCTMLACLFQGLAAGLMSAWAVEGRDIFIGAGQEANIGLYAFGFAWGAVGCFFTASVLYVLAGVVTGEGPARERRERQERRALKAGIVMVPNNAPAKDEF